MIRLAAVLAVAASQAAALSCLPPDPARSFSFAANEPDRRFSIVAGRLDFTPTTGPKRPMGEPRPPFSARLSGDALNVDGFTFPFNQRITVRPTCAGSWCGNIPEPLSAVFIIERTSRGYEIEAGPCGGELFDDTPAVRQIFETCMSGGTCEPAQ